MLIFFCSFHHDDVVDTEAFEGDGIAIAHDVKHLDWFEVHVVETVFFALCFIFCRTFL